MMLRKFVRTYLTEKVRQRSSGSLKSQRFSLNRFKEIVEMGSGVQPLLQYLRNRLTYVGTGSSRIVFLLSSQKVIKVAMNDKGLAQNEAELDVFTNPKARNVIAKIHDYDSKFRWLISDLVHAPRDDMAVLVGMGFDRQHDFYAIDYAFDEAMESITKNKINSFVNKYNDGRMHVSEERNELLKNFLLNLNAMIFIGDLQMGDIVPKHFGQTRDGNVVLFDYGYTTEVAEKHYGNNMNVDDQSPYFSPDVVDKECAYRGIPEEAREFIVGIFEDPGEFAMEYDLKLKASYEGKVEIMRGWPRVIGLLASKMGDPEGFSYAERSRDDLDPQIELIWNMFFEAPRNEYDSTEPV